MKTTNKKILLLYLSLLVIYVRPDVAFLPSAKKLDDHDIVYNVDLYDDAYIDDYQVETNDTVYSHTIEDNHQSSELNEDSTTSSFYDDDEDESEYDNSKTPQDYCVLMLNEMKMPLSRFTSNSVISEAVHVFLGDDLVFECHIPGKLLTSKIEWLLNDTLVDLNDHSFNLVIDKRMLNSNYDRLVVKSKFRMSNIMYIVQFPLIILGWYSIFFKFNVNQLLNVNFFKQIITFLSTACLITNTIYTSIDKL